MREFDAILIPGGGVRQDGELPDHALARFDRALGYEPVAEYFVCLSAGTPHRPPPLESGYPLPECVAGARYLMSRGVPARRIRLENASYDTIGNAYMAHLLHADPAGWNKALVITSQFHMPRTRAIFDWVFGLAPARCRLAFDATPDPAIAEESLRRREQKEQAALRAFEQTRSQIHDLRELNRWFLEEHAAYSAAGFAQPREAAADHVLLETY